MFDAAKTCRTCMKTDVNLVSLFDPWNVDENSYFQVADALAEVTTTQIAREDGLPQCLCELCFKTLEMSYTFRNQALKVDLELRKLFLLQPSVKAEPEEIKSEDDYTDEATDFDYVKTEDDESLYKIVSEATKPIYECYTCSKQYKSKKGYLQHIASHNDKLQCSECNKKFSQQNSLDLHMSLAHTGIEEIYTDRNNSYENKEVKTEIKTESNDKLVCKICDLQFEKRRSLASHMKKHSGRKKNYICDECNMVFKSKSVLVRHMKLHTNIRPYECQQCGKRYSRVDQLKTHAKKHSSTKANVCPYCKKGFSQMCNLRDHIRTHTGEIPYLCSECGKGFNNSSNLRQHMLRHTGVKPFSCNLCPKTFCTKGQMTVHLDTHTGAHPHKCEQCGASFTKPQSLKKHSLIHLGVKPYQCDVCPKRFLVKDHLTRHQRIHTGEKPYRCQFCARAFSQSNDMTKHMRTHVGQNIYQCTVCQQRYRTQNDLKKHYPTHYINGLAPEAAKQLSEDNSNAPDQPAVELNNTLNGSKAAIGVTNHGVGGTDSSIIGTDHGINVTDQRITITFNPDIVDKDTGIAGSITINMDPEAD